MADNKYSCCNPQGGSSPRNEMVCIETNRILDSCRDRDCFEDVKVILTDFGNDIINRTTNVRAKNACISWTYIGIDPVKFNRGFYSVTIKFYVKITFEACLCGGRSQEFEGVAVLEKKVILYGSESNVSIFKSNPDASDYCALPEPCCAGKNVPIAIVEVVDPIILGTKIREPGDNCCCCCCCCGDIPDHVVAGISGTLNDCGSEDRYLTVSIGIFSVVRIVRPAQYLINATEYCVPDKECIAAEDDNPCSLFRSMDFPTSEFCPPSYSHHRDNDKGGKCSCQS
ncbi:MAG: hypothetical protein E7641_02460 [Ruminococcaceae bacterium]|nr:hypothetical protein [Oscillospiraceae bacterium]